MTLTSGGILGVMLMEWEQFRKAIYSQSSFRVSYCMNEFVKECKNKNQFNKTLVHLASEFSRSCRFDGSEVITEGQQALPPFLPELDPSLPRIVGELAETGWSNGKWKGTGVKIQVVLVLKMYLILLNIFITAFHGLENLLVIKIRS